MLEEHVYFCSVFLRWSSEAAYPHLVEGFAPMFPRLLRSTVPKIVRRSIMKKCHAQGVGRHTKQEVLALLAADLGALSVLLGTNPYLLGDAATSYDATAYG